ncbi:ABC transporter ATP-binding protein [Aquihabitans sp. McL0605]|uniref:ABC transporter ATP-binding protein n=1 Tax=Aquihabitans sp. McL0605 TaxID=3415671 RepID=UPI003CEEBB14
MGDQAVLQVEGVVKGYGDHTALHGVSLEVEAGEVCGLLGPNGAGKTTLVSIIAGLRSPDAGRVLVDGLDIAQHGREARQAVGLAGQTTGIYPTVSVRENLELFTRLAGYSGAGVAKRLEEVAEVVELTELLDRQARNLSGGEQRRLHTAMALVNRPKVLMLDEPTTGVDIATRARLLHAIGRLTADEGCAVVYSTHYLPEVEELGASVAILDHGRILARGPLASLVDEHGSGLVELTFDGPAPELPGAVVDGSVARVTTDRPGPDAAALVGSLGADAERLISVDLSRPSLETVFLAVTGRAYSSDVEQELAG